MRSGSVLNVEASDLAIVKAKDVHHRLVLQPLRLIVQRPAFEIADGLLDLHDDRAICGLSETHRLDVRADNSPLAGPILSDGLKPMNMATIQAVGPSSDRARHARPSQPCRKSRSAAGNATGSSNRYSCSPPSDQHPMLRVRSSIAARCPPTTRREASNRVCRTSPLVRARRSLIPRTAPRLA